MQVGALPEGCGLRPFSSLPEPRELAAWADEMFDHIALLESSSGVGEKSRFTIVAIGAEKYVEEPEPLKVYDSLDSLVGRPSCSFVPCPGLSIGVVGYEAVASAEPWLEPKLSRHSWPSLVGFEPEVLAIYDNHLGRVIVCPRDAELGARSIPGFSRASGPVYETPRREFESWVGEALEMIRSGEFIQVVLSRVERYEYSGSPLALYSRLAGLNPSPYMFYIRAGVRWIAGSSPELLLKMDNGRLETHPIAGTRPRGRDGLEDLRLEEELLADEKERAEHLMLVDLARNDLGVHAVPGSVRVTRFMDVEKYSSVQHIVSRVEATAKRGVRYSEVLKAVNPAGTVSGAPKPRAMEAIAALEDEPRGPYAGAVGLFADYAGETAIIIRSLWSAGDDLVETRAGAGIVFDSRPEREYMETVHKLAAVRRALGLGGGGGV
ncbi:MAG: anthranilate synthase component I family protein [Aeropyrum sp.]|nr:anthranilate synthase component I family protein [Aeropyrum sp.]